MGASLLLVLVLATIVGSDATWCVCRSDQPASALQKTLDYACGAGADCTTILQNGACYSPDTVVSHCSYAANSYFQRNGQAQGSCDFTSTALVTTTDPSYAGCSYPATPSAATTTGTPTTTNTTTTGTPTTTGIPSTFTPTTTTGTGGVLGGLGPSGTTSIDSTGSHAGLLPRAKLLSSLFLPVLLLLLIRF